MGVVACAWAREKLPAATSSTAACRRERLFMGRVPVESGREIKIGETRWRPVCTAGVRCRANSKNDAFPANRLGEHGDGPKVGCATCHKGTFKPLNGVSPLGDYLALSGVGKVPPGVPSEPAASAAEAGPSKPAPKR